jgi:hypothetical protein
MDLPALYDEDLHAWALHQAEALRRLKAAGLPLPNDLDLEHVAEEIEDLGNEQRFQVASNLVQAMIHLAKVAAAPASPSVPHWLQEAGTFLDNAGDRFTPSMRRTLDMPALWRKVRRRLIRREMIEACFAEALPEAPPFALEELLDPDAAPGALAAQLAAKMRDTA